MEMEKICYSCGKEANMVCSMCKGRRYCSSECQNSHWKKHKEECFDRNKFKRIVVKLNRELLIRHVNGNTLDNRIENLKKVSVAEAFRNKDWTVDVVCHLTDSEYEIWEKASSLLPTL